MDTIFYTFLTERKEFIQNLAQKKIYVNPTVAGILLSITKPELVNTIYYIESLERLISELSDLTAVSYCMLKFYRISYKIIKDFPKNSELIKIYNKISLKLPNVHSNPAVQQEISKFFTLTYPLLLSQSCSSFTFLDIFNVGQQNLKIFPDPPLILTSPLLENMSKLHHLQQFYEYSEFLQAYKKIGQFLMKCTHPDRIPVCKFLYLLTESKCKSRDQEFVVFVQKNLEVLGRCFPQECIFKLQNIFQEVFKPDAIPEFIPFGQSVNLEGVNTENSVLPIQKINSFEYNKGDIHIHFGNGSYKNLETGEVVEEEAKEDCDEYKINESSIIAAESFQQVILDLHDYYKANKFIDLETVQTELVIHRIDYPSLKPVIFHVLLEKIYEFCTLEDFEFWNTVVQATKTLFSPEELSFLQSNLPELKKPGHSSKGTPLYNRRKRPPSRQSSGMSRDVPLNPSHSYSDDLSESIEFIPLSLQHEPGHVHSSLSFKDYFEFLSISMSDHIFSTLNPFQKSSSITSTFLDLKQFIKEKSPSASLSIIGSFFHGTYIPDSVIDLSFLDFLSPDPQSLLKSAAAHLSLGEFEETFSSLYLNNGLIFTFIVNQEFAHHDSAIIKEYCGLDHRCQKLILLFKLWMMKNNVWGHEYPSGFQISLLIIVFLQLTDPPVLPRLQQFPHEPKMISDVDVWFATNQRTESQNKQSLGELFHLLLQFIKDLAQGNFIADPFDGLVHDAASDRFLPVLSPFEHKIVASVAKGNEKCENFLSKVKETIRGLDNKEEFERIFNTFK